MNRQDLRKKIKRILSTLSGDSAVEKIMELFAPALNKLEKFEQEKQDKFAQDFEKYH